MKTQGQFEQFYNIELEPKINELESRRLKAKYLIIAIIIFFRD